MVNALLFSIIAVLLVYVAFKYFGIWLGCMFSLVYMFLVVIVPIVSIVLLSSVIVGILKLIMYVLVQKQGNRKSQFRLNRLKILHFCAFFITSFEFRKVQLHLLKGVICNFL